MADCTGFDSTAHMTCPNGSRTWLTGAASARRGPFISPGSAGCRVLAILLAMLAAAGTGAGQRGSFPGRLESYFSTAGRLSAGERRLLAAGQPVTKLLDADESKEMAVLGAVWIDAPMRRYVEAVTDIERFENGGGFRMTTRISTPPRLEDFAALRLPDEDFADLRTCRVGDCGIKLGEQALRRFRNDIDWRAPTARDDVNALMRRLTLDYVTRYLEGGNSELAVYRDNPAPTSVAEEFRAMVDGMPGLTTQMPNLRRYLLEYPAVTLPGATSFLYWQETDFGLKPTIRISHLTIREGPEDTVVASKMLYASHYFWTGIEIRVLVPDPARGAGFWFVTVSRSRSDGLSGFAGFFVRRRVRSEVRNGALAALKVTKDKLERAR